ncbi:MAG: Tol-Pal system beta propeller repeat protein TolB [Burkholderiaceae bacterium]|jgi:TolB protein|nr:Tol-Pal system beta propeller repeat protein TolB [Burkholderiaceae bacterium]
MRRICFFLLCLLAISVYAQDKIHIEIAGVGANRVAVAIADFEGESAAPQKLSAIIKADLARSGFFRVVDTGAVMGQSAGVNSADWRAKGVEAVATGTVSLSGSRFLINYRLHGTAQSRELSSLSLSFPAQPVSARLVAHKVADDIYEKLLGIKGIFSTRIAYVTRSGREYRLEVADADGEGKQVALRSNEPIISPSWSPDGTKVAYVSFEAKKPIVYIQNLVTKQRTVVAGYRGSNSAPAWSPDGSQLAVALARNGLTQIYVVNADGKGLRQLTNTQSINTEPRFSPDGRFIYFTSDRSGNPQVYKMGSHGSGVQRVTFNGSYNISPRVSPDGRQLAYISRRDGGYRLYLLDMTNGQELRLSDTARDESPSFSPNGKYIMYATRTGSRAILHVVSTDGLVRQKLTMRASGIREPAWGPFMP